MTNLAKQLAQCTTAGLFDVLRIHRLPILELPRNIRPLDPKTKLAGPIFTVLGEADADISADESLELWIKNVLSGAPADHVVVCQPQDDTRSAMGDLSAEALRRRGVLGYYIDGGSRDAEEICEINFPVFCKYTSPVDIVGTWRLTATNVPIEIGGIVISPGDYILADRDGALLVHAADAEFAITEAVKAQSTDSTMRDAIRQGRDPYDAFLEFRKL
jgi:4-hydroxy-4-methyl-2-oxoglutarate aldolase